MKESVITTFPSFSINSLILKRTESTNIDTLPRKTHFFLQKASETNTRRNCALSMESRVASHATLQYTLYRRFPRNNSSDFPAERSQLESNNRNLHSMPRNKKRFVGGGRESLFPPRWDPFFVIELIRVHHLTLFTDRRWSKCLLRMDAPAFCSIDLADFSPFFPPLEIVVCHPSFFFPRLRSRERPSRTSANYLQLEISKGRKRRKEVDSPFPRVFESISKKGYSQSSSKFRKESLSIDCFFLFWNFYSFPTKNMIPI